MTGPSTAARRRYDNRARRQKAAETRARIVAAGTELVHGFDTWNWRDLTFRAVADRAGVGERTVYRHFPTERHLHDAVMQRLESEAGICYEDVDLGNLAEVTGRVFASLQRFSVRQSMQAPNDPTFVTVDHRRRQALLRAVSTAAPHWSPTDQHLVAGLLDVLWNLPSYERLVGVWNVDGDDATRAIGWLMDKVIDSIKRDKPVVTGKRDTFRAPRSPRRR
ncbi:TetR/AcrR family transcriptional regulator [Mycobacterium sp. 1081908.1]|uniref:TetR/AcrR family transcriptional regulator n=1 Tax=Mycobacterium sp. 1081908.1 TaxID=1834066 RepID=UPI0007FDF4C0|nr:TetR/AcrR family transcriptional regulator [Mycobacterium sp. 1081908.1]OBK45287.1 TetR family transcriptional regulator [Mycobacterium sp. 1081908.1]